MSIYRDKVNLRREVIRKQEEMYPGFWDMVHKILPHLPDRKQELLADLIHIYIEPKKVK